MEPRTTRQVLALAKQVIEAVAAHVQAGESRLPGVRELAQHMLTGDDRRIPERLLRPNMLPGHPDFREVMASASDSAIFRLWGQSKVAYAMDDLLLGYLSQSSSSRVPTAVLRNLPHPNPFVLLPRPDLSDPATDYYRTHIGVPLGAFVFGRYNATQQLCSTADDRREDLGLMFAGFIEHGNEDPALQVLRCTIPLSAATLTVDDVVTTTVAKFAFNADLAEDDPGRLEAWLRTYVAQAFNSLLYVCTDQPDISVHSSAGGRTGRAARKKAQRRPRPGDIDTMVTLGFRLGPALHEAHRQWEHQQPHGLQQTGPSGQRKRPHQKKGHYRTYWTGPGRQIPVVKWIAPFWVNQDLTPAPRDVVVRPVRKQP